jgi:macrolide phosphotransferase
MKQDDTLNLAANHGLQLKGSMRLNEMGIDFRVVFAKDLSDREWVLRIPRRKNLSYQIEHEKKILDFVRKHLSITVPDWRISDPALIAYPSLEGEPVITFDSTTHKITWNVDREKNCLTSSLAKILFDLHRIPFPEAADLGLEALTVKQIRQELLDDIEEVKREIGLSIELETRWRTWIDTDDFWPDFTTFVHGDLYAGHILSDAVGNISGIIDWSEARLSDSSIDFSGHLAVFGVKALKELISEYGAIGGRVWDKMFEHTRERHSASPLKYAVFALRTEMDEHINAAKSQLGISD